MTSHPDNPNEEFTARVEQALEAAWRGEYAPLNELVADDNVTGPGAATILGALTADPPADTPGLRSGANIGGYEIVGELGRGGMGVVYDAQQLDTGRCVALKVIRGAAGSDLRLDKLFHREIRTLARLQHPGIATIYDAHSTEDGLHFFAMELVRGTSLIELVPGRNQRAEPVMPALRDRLRVFCDICDAVSHAHQHGVIHRDLKPSNVLVDESGRPKVLDFGLARITDADLSIAGGATETGQLIGTVPYMSPEQVRGLVDKIDIRSDVYALGVMLYKLATGLRPFDLRWGDAPILPEAARLICEEPPPRPSTVDRTIADDLDTIILKALEKEPARRYQSAAALGEDVQRYLSGHAILARPPSTAYQLRKLMGRHKLVTGLGAALVVLAIVSAIVFGVQAIELGRQRDQARAEADRALRINAFLQDMVGAIDPERSGPQLRVRELLDEVAATLGTELAGEPEVRASLHHSLAGYYLALRMLPEAQQHADAAIELWQSLHGRKHPSVARALHRLAQVINAGGGGERHLELAKEAYEIRMSLLGPDHIDTAESMEGIAGLQVSRGDYEEAVRIWRSVLATYRTHYGEHRNVARALRKLAQVLVWAGRYDEAEALLTEYLDLRRRLAGKAHYDVAQALTELGEIHIQRADYRRAEDVFRERIQVLKELVEGDDIELARALCDLAIALSQQDRSAEAETLYRDSLAMARRMMGDDHGQVALASNNLAVHLREEGRFKEAEPLAADTYRIWSVYDRPNASRAYGAGNLADVLIELGRHDEAERLHREAINNWRALKGNQNPKITDSLVGLGRLAQLRGDRDAAERYYREALELRQTNLGEQHPKTLRCRIRVAGVLPRQEATEAATACLAALADLEAAPGARRSDISWALCQCADILEAQEDRTQAADLYRQAIVIERDAGHDLHPVLATALTGLGEFLNQAGDPEQAEPLLRAALEIREHCFVPGDERIAATQAALATCRTAIKGPQLPDARSKDAIGGTEPKNHP
ncbi:MAG: serine/threonine protein kinase [bacterium]|nr:serine/threonine protein kinase [bacterium]